MECVHLVGFGHDGRLDVSFRHVWAGRCGLFSLAGGAKELGFGALQFRDEDSSAASPAWKRSLAGSQVRDGRIVQNSYMSQFRVKGSAVRLIAAGAGVKLVNVRETAA